MTAEDLDTLRSEGFDDTAIHDATQVISYFNYINRIADGLGVDAEDEMELSPAEWHQRKGRDYATSS